MPIDLYTLNLIETAHVTANLTSLRPLARLFDNAQGPQYQPAVPAAWTLSDLAPLPLAMGKSTSTGSILAIDIDLGSIANPTALWLVHDNAADDSVIIGVQTGPTFPPAFGTSIGPSLIGVIHQVPLIFGATRYVRVSFYDGSGVTPPNVIPRIGELVLGTPRTIPTPAWDPAPDWSIQGNVAADESPGGVLVKAQVGTARKSVTYGWKMSAADLLIVQGAYAETLESAKSFLMIDYDSTPRWVEFVDASLRWRRLPVLPGSGGLNEVTVQFREALA